MPFSICRVSSNQSDRYQECMLRKKTSQLTTSEILKLVSFDSSNKTRGKRENLHRLFDFYKYSVKNVRKKYPPATITVGRRVRATESP